MREKLIELIRKADKEDYLSRTQDEHYAAMAGSLIANGVTIQKWIPVSEWLPEPNEIVMVWSDKTREMNTISRLDHFEVDEATHWMPLPEPPEGE